jgi:hypothetical protein
MKLLIQVEKPWQQLWLCVRFSGTNVINSGNLHFAHRAGRKHAGKRDVTLLLEETGYIVGPVFAQLLIKRRAARRWGIALHLDHVGSDRLGLISQLQGLWFISGLLAAAMLALLATRFKSRSRRRISSQVNPGQQRKRRTKTLNVAIAKIRAQRKGIVLKQTREGNLSLLPEFPIVGCHQKNGVRGT